MIFLAFRISNQEVFFSRDTKGELAKAEGLSNAYFFAKLSIYLTCRTNARPLRMERDTAKNSEMMKVIEF